MDKSTLPGIVVGIGALIVGILMEGGELAAFLNVPAAFIVFGGTLGVALTSFPLATVVKIPKYFKKVVTDVHHDLNDAIETFVKLADKARREGLLALEQEAAGLDDFTKKGVQMVVDGSDPSLVREVLEADVDAMKRRHHEGVAFFEGLGGYAPTLGIIGTVMGLVNVLGHLEDPSDLGHLIAGAFIATLYGVASANLLWLPLGTKLKVKSHEEATVRELAIEGILAVQAGDNPRMVREKLESYLPPALRGKGEAAAAKSVTAAAA